MVSQSVDDDMVLEDLERRTTDMMEVLTFHPSVEEIQLRRKFKAPAKL